jgi:hypothetical protein
MHFAQTLCGSVQLLCGFCVVSVRILWFQVIDFIKQSPLPNSFCADFEKNAHFDKDCMGLGYGQSFGAGCHRQRVSVRHASILPFCLLIYIVRLMALIACKCREINFKRA